MNIIPNSQQQYSSYSGKDLNKKISRSITNGRAINQKIDNLKSDDKIFRSKDKSIENSKIEDSVKDNVKRSIGKYL